MNSGLVAEFQKCAADPVYYIETYCKIRHLKKGIIPFKLFDWQKDYITTLEEGRNIITLKSRQTGVTTLMMAYASYLCIFKPIPQRILALSQSLKKANEIIDKLDTILDKLPQWILGNDEIYISSHTKRPAEVTFTHARYDRLGEKFIARHHNIIKALSTTSSSGAGESANLVLLDEMALMRNDHEVWTAVAPTAIHGGQIVIVSTPRRTANQYARLWTKATSGAMPDYIPIRIHYTDSGMTREGIQRVIGDMPQHQWDQEFELSFAVAGTPVFNQKDLAACYRPLDFRGNVSNLIRRWMEFSHIGGTETSFEEMRRVFDYITSAIDQSTIFYSGVDSASGGEDSNCIVALNERGIIANFMINTYKLTKWAGHDFVDEQGQRIAVPGLVSKWHRDHPGIMVIEENGPGQVVKSRFVYPEDDHSQVLFKITMDNRQRTGTKTQIILALQQAIERHELIITNSVVYEQLKAFSYIGSSGRMAASPGMHDDAVIALAWAYYGFQKYNTQAPQILPKFKRHTINPTKKRDFGVQVIQKENPFNSFGLGNLGQDFDLRRIGLL